MKRKTFAICLALMGVLALLAGGVVWAQTAPDIPAVHRHQVLRGTVVERDTAWLVIETNEGDVQVATDDATRCRLQGRPEVQVGDLVIVRADLLDDGSLRAEVVAHQAESRPVVFAVRGSIVGMAENRLSVRTAAGDDRSVLLDESTRLWAPPSPPTSTLALQVGDSILAIGRPEPDSGDPPALRARLVMVASDEDLPRYVIQGQVVAVARQTVVVRSGLRERAISLTARTQMVGNRWPRVSDRLVALGQPTELGQWVAGVVYIPGGRTVGQGQVPGPGEGSEP